MNISRMLSVSLVCVTIVIGAIALKDLDVFFYCALLCVGAIVAIAIIDMIEKRIGG